MVARRQDHANGDRQAHARYPEGLVQRARDLHEYEGLSYEAVAGQLGVPVATVEKWCQFARRAPSSAGTRRTPSRRQIEAWRRSCAAARAARQWPQEVRLRARQMRTDGLRYGEIGNELGVPSETVRNWVRGVHRRRRRWPRGTNEGAACAMR